MVPCRSCIQRCCQTKLVAPPVDDIGEQESANVLQERKKQQRYLLSTRNMGPLELPKHTLLKCLLFGSCFFTCSAVHHTITPYHEVHQVFFCTMRRTGFRALATRRLLWTCSHLLLYQRQYRLLEIAASRVLRLRPRNQLIGGTSPPMTQNSIIITSLPPLFIAISASWPCRYNTPTAFLCNTCPAASTSPYPRQPHTHHEHFKPVKALARDAAMPSSFVHHPPTSTTPYPRNPHTTPGTL